MSRRPLWSAALAVLLAAGCAAVPPSPDTPSAEASWRAHADRLARLTAWDLDGRLGVRNREEGARVDIAWRQGARDYDVRLSSSLGQGVAVLEGDADRARLRMPDGQVLEERDAETLLRRHFGWVVPVDDLRYWVLGLPSPGDAEMQRLDEQGRLSFLRQGDWRVSFRDYVDVDGLALPRKLYLYTDSLEVRVVIDRWRLPAG